MARVLDAPLAHYAEVVLRDLGIETTALTGEGAAGGLAAGLVAFCGATIRAGFDVVAEAVGLAERIAAADVVVTGEGRLDRQTAFGKTTAGVARLARATGKRVVAIAGSVQDGAEQPFDAVFALTPELGPRQEAQLRPREYLLRGAQSVARWVSNEHSGD
jgi:glycerate kinase